ncbi:uncharacterized protein PHALS_11587 [Plasmopara halstedii]|uniref:Uncharacterized protein n=1 Tax=Plasmopara halstedii TaxID=4781 RepID=A0A0P1AJH5_PLAHL|nr:uncharacterized protein PHALS_11587 [Plasmopara halstedii]CEG41225.1 hypothetical protein PHALS_11587 [Plasmopara halstedii]|eukprot:XP_024577594.1 hypothetical protein PHALS_11587 [Plasmopara halstedii]
MHAETEGSRGLLPIPSEGKNSPHLRSLRDVKILLQQFYPEVLPLPLIPSVSISFANEAENLIAARFSLAS